MKTPLLYALLVLCGALWGGTVPLTKIAVSTGHHPLGLLVWQLAVSCIALAAIVGWRRSPLFFDARHLLFFFIIALTGTLVPNGASYVAYEHLPAAVMAIVIALVPFFSLIIAALFGLERPTVKRLFGIVLGAVAIALIVLPESSLPDPTKAVFILLGLLSTLCYGIEGNYVAARQPRDTGPFATLFVSCVMGLAITLPIGAATGTLVLPWNGFGAPEIALTATALLHVGAYALYLWLNRVAGAVFSAQVSYIVTPVGVVCSTLFLGEKLAATIWIALFVLMAGIALVQPREDEAEEDESAA